MTDDDVRIPVTHGGSLPRPQDLLRLIVAHHHGEPYDRAAYEARLRRCVADVVRRQVDAGVDWVSDGEFGKSMTWARYILERVSGFEEVPWGPEGSRHHRMARVGADRRAFPEFYAAFDRERAEERFRRPERGDWVCTGPIRYVGHAALQRDISNLRAAIAAAGAPDGFLPVVAPASAVPVRIDTHYSTGEEFLFALADALHEEYRAIADAGLMVQVDDAFLATMFDTMVPPATMEEYRAWAELRIEALNHALRGVPLERSRYHVCWGSWNGPHTGDVPLRAIVDLILRVRVGHYLLEQANPRHEHEWRVWEDVKLPDDRKLVPGVISHATNIVEHPELVAQRLVRLAKLVGHERVVAGTDCGFAQSPGVERVHPTIVWAKLNALAQGAALASRELRA